MSSRITAVCWPVIFGAVRGQARGQKGLGGSMGVGGTPQGVPPCCRGQGVDGACGWATPIDLPIHSKSGDWLAQAGGTPRSWGGFLVGMAQQHIAKIGANLHDPEEKREQFPLNLPFEVRKIF